MTNKSYSFKNVNLNVTDGILENIFNIPGYPIVDLRNYKIDEIPKYFFYYNSNIKKVILPDNLKSIGNASFNGCYNLKEFTIPETVEYVDDFLLYNSKIYEDQTNWEDNIFYKDGWAISHKEGITSLNIREGTKGISDGFAFHTLTNEPSSIASISLPSTLEIICSSAFCENSIKSIIIPKNVKRIEDYAFSRCELLERIELYATDLEDDETKYMAPFARSGENSTSENSTIFIGKDVKKLPYRLFADVSLHNVEFEKGTKFETFGKYCFWGADLKRITIPVTTKEIRSGAFFLNSLLQSINFEGTMNQWKSIVKGASWNAYVPATYVQCTDGQVQL